MKMDLTEFLLVFAMLWKITTGLRCYKCEAMAETYTEPLCEHFDFSSKYIMECDNSTMCYQRITTTQFGTKIYEKGCAKQTMSGYQELHNRKWREVIKINEVYREGCVESPGDVDRVTRTEHCFCRRGLCNGVDDVESNVIKMGTNNNARVVPISVFTMGVSAVIAAFKIAL